MNLLEAGRTYLLKLSATMNKLLQVENLITNYGESMAIVAKSADLLHKTNLSLLEWISLSEKNLGKNQPPTFLEEQKSVHFDKFTPSVQT